MENFIFCAVCNEGLLCYFRVTTNNRLAPQGFLAFSPKSTSSNFREHLQMNGSLQQNTKVVLNNIIQNPSERQTQVVYSCSKSTIKALEHCKGRYCTITLVSYLDLPVSSDAVVMLFC